MKNPFFILAFVAVLFSSCGPKPEELAEKAVKDFFQALADKDFEKAKTLSNESTKPILDIVMKENEKYKDLNKNDKQPVIKVDIVEKTMREKDGDIKVKILIDEKERVEVIHVVPVEKVWLVEVPKTQINIIRIPVFCGNYDVILVKFKHLHPDVRFHFDVDDDDHGHKHKKHHDNGKHKGWYK